VLVKEAGGIINDINLNNLENINVIASNPNINTKFQEKLHNF
jgi:myo-inositol-1(or 4)-monophosphatase